MWRGCMGQSPIDDGLIDLAIRAANHARTLDLACLDERNGKNGDHHIWPGEHYRLLASLVDLLQPKVIVEFGTFYGLSSLAMKSAQPAGGLLATFDVVLWRDFPETLLRDEDFQDGSLVQHLDNLADPLAIEKHRELLESADLIFIDGPKDGKTEPLLFANFEKIHFRKQPIMVIDDIHAFKFIPTWEAIRHPKYDITSFGHWTGTGLVHWR